MVVVVVVVVDFTAGPTLPRLQWRRDSKCGRRGRQGECGACMVLVDGKPQTSCNLPVWSVQDSHITTLEGLGTPEAPHPVQTAFLENRAAQCGFCVSGIVTSAAALLTHQPNPSRQDIAQALDKHLCRCCAHVRMIRAIEQAAQHMPPVALQD